MQPESGCFNPVLHGTPSQPHEGDGITHSINRCSESTYYVQDAGIMLGTGKTANKEALPHRAGCLTAAVSDMLLQKLVLLTHRYSEACAVSIDVQSLYDKRPKDMPLLLLLITADSG